MTSAELIEHLTAIVKEQADIIRIQSEVIAQLGYSEDIDQMVNAVSQKREAILSD